MTDINKETVITMLDVAVAAFKAGAWTWWDGEVPTREMLRDQWVKLAMELVDSPDITNISTGRLEVEREEQAGAFRFSINCGVLYESDDVDWETICPEYFEIAPESEPCEALCTSCGGEVCPCCGVELRRLYKD
jgi:hypothetical protein